ncbi:AraC-like DNA-binding protein [Roseiarcus fermentans]|uniref:AraC-like DNA-binding protein n=1 Tax=Roseiarcus fermentans TaxID=1473586 RepID=A0A366FP59_9HYPH|nr:AraC family transcriptional regulator [Roseiarcus fermentans]RBP16432.1 AraC-like DNA-binding protein [Roseiarcus fermentans]
MDPLSQIITLLKPQAVFWRVVEAHDAWTIRFLPSDVVVFGQMIEGAARVERDDGAGLDLATGDFMLMAAPPPWTMTGGGGGAPVDFKAAIADPGLLVSAGRKGTITRFIAGNFSFAPANADLVASLMLPIAHVRATDTLVARLGALLSALGDEALADRPGRSLVLDRLLEVLLIEALRYRSSAIPGSDRGLLAGLADAKVGRALRIMHEDARRSWTVAALANAVGMSRSAFAARFTHIMGMPPIDYLANWRMTLAKAALASSNLPMTEIAEIAGYQSVSAFSTGFKRATGLSPKFYTQSLAT